jgi:hypothetical protein
MDTLEATRVGAMQLDRNRDATGRPSQSTRTGPTIGGAVYRYQGGNVKKALAAFLIVGFVLVDFLFFHDILKAGETITFPQYLTGVLSVPVLIVSALYLLRADRGVQLPG